MNRYSQSWDRRNFIVSLAAAGAVGALSPSASIGASKVKKRNIKLGFDNFSIRDLKWKAPQLLDYAAKIKVDTLLMSDLGVYENYDEAYLKKIKEQANRLGVEIQAGTGSICPTSRSYNKVKWGPAEEHLKLLIRIAKTLGSPVARCYLGNNGDRKSEGGIYRHIEETVKVCKAMRSYAVDSNVKIAIENHAGDMQAWELAELIEAAGKDFVGATMDPGNATWTLEDPMLNLEILGPYAATAGIRDSEVWETEKGASVMWANVGQGLTDWPAYVDRFEELCPGVPFVLEIISYTWIRELPYLDPAMWKAFPKARAGEFARFLALAKQGKPYTLPKGRPTGDKSAKLTQQQQMFDLEESVKYCKNVLGLGLKD